MKERIMMAAGVCALVLAVLLLLGATTEKTEKVWTTYTVRGGDKLYDIAAELGIRNWQEWCYEVCKENGIKDGGTIYPGETIMIYEEVKR